MPEFLTSPFANGVHADPWQIFARMAVALALGGIIAWIYARTTRSTDLGATFPITLTFLTVLIAMVTQVIGDSVARAFSLVGALSIVRFRTVVRDTRDTAFVIFAVVTGMALGARSYWVAVIGLAIIGITSFAIARFSRIGKRQGLPYLLTVRVGLGHDLDQLLGGVFETHLESRDLMSVSTARQGASVDAVYEAYFKPQSSADEMVKALNRLEGVQSVRLNRRGFDAD